MCLKAFGFNVKKKDIIDLRREYDQKQTGRIDFIDFSDISTVNPSLRCHCSCSDYINVSHFFCFSFIIAKFVIFSLFAFVSALL